MRRFKLIWDRLNCLIAWPLLFVVDLGIAWSGVEKWCEAREYSNNALLNVWNRNEQSKEEEN